MPALPCPQELSNDKAAAEAELNGKLGTLRYLVGIKQREQARAVAAAAAAPATEEDGEPAGGTAGGGGPAAADGGSEGREEAAAATGGGGLQSGAGAGGPARMQGQGGLEADICPVCHDELGQELVRGRWTPAVLPHAAAVAMQLLAVTALAVAASRAPTIPPGAPCLQVMLSCAHRMCCKCCMALQDRLPAAQPQVRRSCTAPIPRAAFKPVARS